MRFVLVMSEPDGKKAGNAALCPKNSVFPAR